MSVERRALALALIAAAGLRAAPARAEGHHAGYDRRSDDGVYGRFGGDLELALGFGAELGSAGEPAGIVRGAAYYYSSAGIYLLGRAPFEPGGARALLEPGIEVKPLFLLRWQNALEQGPAFWDLTLDSCSISGGAFWSSVPGRSFGGEHGFGFGFGFGLPLFARANGPWLEARGLMRFPSLLPREDALYALLSWHGFLLTPLIGD